MPQPVAEPCVVVIFGASGDLTARKLIPALYEMARERMLPEETQVLGVARTDLSDNGWRDTLKPWAAEHAKGFDPDAWAAFARRLHYSAGSATDDADMQRVSARISEISNRHGCLNNILFYLSVKPSLYEPIIEHIDRAGMVTEGKRWCALDRDQTSWQRIIVEKPFGRDLETAATLNRALGRVFEEDAIYRIDHYLGKELVQNLLVLRFANTIFEPLWNHRYVDHVQITAAETVGVGHRAAFYDEAGAVRDMIQSHLMQVLALVAMEPPTAFSAEYIRSEKIKIIDAIEPIPPRELPLAAALGQYAGDSEEGAFHEAEHVRKGSNTETFAAVRFRFDNWRWSGTPFYIRTGKRLAKKRTEIVVQFKRPPANLFAPKRGTDEAAERAAERPANQLVIEIAPNPGVSVRFEGKVPGPGVRIGSVEMDFDFVEQFGNKPVESYGPLIIDTMRGDQTLFPHRLEVEGAWRAVMPLLCDDSKAIRANIHANYTPGSWGPAPADQLLAREARAWRNEG